MGFIVRKIGEKKLFILRKEFFSIFFSKRFLLFYLPKLILNFLKGVQYLKSFPFVWIIYCTDNQYKKQNKTKKMREKKEEEENLKLQKF